MRLKGREGEEKNKLIETISGRPVVLVKHAPSSMDWRLEVHSCVTPLFPTGKKYQPKEIPNANFVAVSFLVALDLLDYEIGR